MQCSDSVGLAQCGKVESFVNAVIIKVYGKTGISVHGAVCSSCGTIMLFPLAMD